ncbi:MAG: universal stress protein [Magnetospirillum sp. WYHS-4]
MTIKTILVPVNGTADSQVALETAMTLGRDLAAHVVALHVAADARDALPLLGEGMSGPMIEDMIDMAAREIAIRKARAREIFDTFVGRYRVALDREAPGPGDLSAEWAETTGPEDGVVARRGRMADLIVVGGSAKDDIARALSLNAALFETGRPVLVAPGTAPTMIGRHVAVAWNGSPQSARAVAAALPLLRRADRVTALAAGRVDEPGASLDDLVAYLAWHDIVADAWSLELGPGQDVGTVILDHAAKAEVDLLVMGAFTHSRMRELILGGVTRHMLEKAAVPLFMAH